MAYVGEIVRYLDDLLRVKEFQDYTHDGLVVEGCESVERVGLAVDACLESFLALQDCQLIITHHGLWWPSTEKLVGWEQRRVKALLQDNINLYCSHLPLDRHPQLGNNAQILAKMGLDITASFADVGWRSNLETPASRRDLVRNFAELMGGEVHSWLFGDDKVSSVAVVSGGGGGSKFLQAVAEEHVDLYLTGDGNHAQYHMAKELGLNVVFGGHYRTEVWGVQALAPLLEELFGVQTRFHECPTGM